MSRISGTKISFAAAASLMFLALLGGSLLPSANAAAAATSSEIESLTLFTKMDGAFKKKEAVNVLSPVMAEVVRPRQSFQPIGAPGPNAALAPPPTFCPQNGCGNASSQECENFCVRQSHYNDYVCTDCYCGCVNYFTKRP